MLHETSVYTAGYERAGRVENRDFGENSKCGSFVIFFFHRFMQYQFREADSDCFIREDLSASVFH